MDTFRTLLINPKDKVCQVVDLVKESYFKHAYALMNVELLDVVFLELEGHLFTILCDDEALLKNEIYFSLFDSNSPLIAGNVIIMHESPVDEEGNSILLDLTDEEIEIIQNNLVTVTNSTTGETNLAVANLKYPNY